MGNNTSDKLAISVSNLGKKFGGIPALEDVSLDVFTGEIFGILGPDGAGKTTLMRILTGLMSYDSGKISVLGYDLSRNNDELCDHIAYMPQRFGLYEDLSVQENIYFYADLFDVKRGPDLENRINQLLDFCRMTPFKERPAGKLSGGMKQKLALTCALIHTPRILFLDEPTNGVDPVSRREFWKILQHMLLSGVTIFVSTTYLDEAERCHRLAFLNKGKITKIDTPQRLKKIFSAKMWRLEVGDKFKAVELLKREKLISSVFIMGAAIHIFTDFGVTREEISQTVAASLTPDHVTIQSLEEIAPNLEDIFIEQSRR